MYLFDVNQATPHSMIAKSFFPEATRRQLEGAETFGISAYKQPGYTRLKALWPTLSPASCSATIDFAENSFSPEKAAFEGPPSTTAANAYDAAVALTLAMQEANQHMNFNPVASGNAIRGYLRNQSFEGASGPLQFYDYGDRDLHGLHLVFSQIVFDPSNDLLGIKAQPIFLGVLDQYTSQWNVSLEGPLQQLIPNSERIYGGGSKVPPKDAVTAAKEQKLAEARATTIALAIALTVGIVRASRSR